ncbi:hypothetical protein [Holdemania massiliensis]|uniref:hypothetical protein n=1 Tax=Holdemania massiliensis TaxID=1468449 RepID=UPI001F0507B4|nr:hypothetical protein [Holdemania massiliensis]MCH1942671.1 hypothetical protein [Holdemania massiliensis]
MKHITELIQKQVVKKHSRALIFYLLLLIITAFLAWVSQSIYVGLFLIVWLAALAVRLIQAVHELGQVKRFTQQLRGPQRLLYRQVDTTFFMEDGWLSWFNKQGVQGTYDEITMCSYALVPLRKSEKLYAPCQLQINTQDGRTTLIQLQKDKDAKTVMRFLKTQNPAIRFSEKVSSSLVRLEELPEKME